MEKLIDCVKYNETKTDVTWETSTLRKWMNSDFINKAFSNDQQTQIITFNNSNPNNPRKHTIGGNATQDKLFALTINDANKYFLDENDRMAAVSTADAPGMAVKGRPFSMQADTRTAPGSEMPGIPASET